MSFPDLGWKPKAGQEWCHESSGGTSQRARPGGYVPSSSTWSTYASLLCPPLQPEVKISYCKQRFSEDQKQCNTSYIVQGTLLFEIWVCLKWFTVLDACLKFLYLNMWY